MKMRYLNVIAKFIDVNFAGMRTSFLSITIGATTAVRGYMITRSKLIEHIESKLAEINENLEDSFYDYTLKKYLEGQKAAYEDVLNKLQDK
jgi:hypothetical protein